MSTFRLVLGISLWVWLPQGLRAETAIQNLCMAGFQSAFAQAGQQPPEGMAVFTCRCLIQRLQVGEALNPARESCKLEASRRFRILPKG